LHTDRVSQQSSFFPEGCPQGELVTTLINPAMQESPPYFWGGLSCVVYVMKKDRGPDTAISSSEGGEDKASSAFDAPAGEAGRLVHVRFTCKRDVRLMNPGDRDGGGSVLQPVVCWKYGEGPSFPKRRLDFPQAGYFPFSNVGGYFFERDRKNTEFIPYITFFS